MAARNDDDIRAHKGDLLRREPPTIICAEESNWFYFEVLFYSSRTVFKMTCSPAPHIAPFILNEFKKLLIFNIQLANNCYSREKSIFTFIFFVICVMHSGYRAQYLYTHNKKTSKLFVFHAPIRRNNLKLLMDDFYLHSSHLNIILTVHRSHDESNMRAQSVHRL